ncbi:hypothetical protein FB192DRAFT_1433149 [Mucor lusitanicus]|uniref:Uncharacterized protein n=2 Tax=Mucor circinelloides f. lusitanicus TaxID=29924 RepID=A0A168MWP9_MUCCL|nr:hypothetical protein FB192DRAFT_1433149 [Mucor lusitanicus]OAD05464.1 hypothetical protein MUCCIDRAFT_80546 [Mucor lusitanicus CBS 277.49]
MSRRWMRLCLQRNKWLCGRCQLFAKSIRHAQTYNQCSAVNDKLMLHLTQMNTSQAQMDASQLGTLGTVFVILCKLGKFLLMMGGCSTYSAAALLEDIKTQHYARGDYSTQETLLVVDKLRDQDEALLQKVSLVTDLVGKCIYMKQQSKDKRKGINMEWVTSGW